MYTALIVLHIVIAVVLVIVVLLQSGKGGGLGAGFGGGGANTLFGSSGGSNFFTKLTMGLAAGFMITSLSISAYKSREMKTSIFDQGKASAPAAPAAPAAPQGAAPVAAPAEAEKAPAAPAKNQ